MTNTQLPWITWYAYTKKPGDFGISDLNGTVNFSVTIESETSYKNAVYMVTETNTGYFYIGKAVNLVRRINTHRLTILANIERKTGIKKIRSRSLDVHKKFAELYKQNGKLDLKITVLSGTGSFNLHKEERTQILKMLAQCSKELCFNISIKKKADPAQYQFS